MVCGLDVIAAVVSRPKGKQAVKARTILEGAGDGDAQAAEASPAYATATDPARSRPCPWMGFDIFCP